MKRLIIYITTLVALSSCYNSPDEPEIAHVYSEVDFADCEIISIKELIDANEDLRFVYNGCRVIEEDIVIRGKVISTDEKGSIYKSLYIIDHQEDITNTRAIELRLFANNYVSYPVGSMVYVRLSGLSIGNYGGMLSIGASSVSEDYPHTTIEGKVMLAEHIFLGERKEMERLDTLIIKPTEGLYPAGMYYYDDPDFNLQDALGRLVRFEQVESAFTYDNYPHWTPYPNTVYPSYFENSDNLFDWSESIGSDLQHPTLAYYGTNPSNDSSALGRFYGSSWFTYDRWGDDNFTGQYVVRISAYAHFREQIIPTDGTKVNITSILTQYGSWSDGGNSVYQLNLNYGEDIVEINYVN